MRIVADVARVCPTSARLWGAAVPGLFDSCARIVIIYEPVDALFNFGNPLSRFGYGFDNRAANPPTVAIT